MRRLTAVGALLGAAVLTLSTSVPGTAVVGGTIDSANRYANVGGLQLRDGGEWFGFCSGTLVAPDIVLTAAHCTDFFTNDIGDPDTLGPDDWRVSFDPDIDEDSVYYGADHFVVHPDTANLPEGHGVNSAPTYLAPGAEDVALVYLEEPVEGITPAAVADAGYLDALDLSHETFTVVGYGINDVVKGSVVSAQPVFLFDGLRRYRDVSVVTTQGIHPDRYLMVSEGSCAGDSGGAVFHGDILVAVVTWGMGLRCDGPALNYRLDSEVAQSFLDTYL